MKRIEIDGVELSKEEWDLLTDYTNLINDKSLFLQQIKETPDVDQRARLMKTFIKEEMLFEKARNLIKTVPNLSIITLMKYKHNN